MDFRYIRGMRIVLDAKNALAAGAFRRLAEVKVLATPEITRAALVDADAVVVRSETRVDAGLLEGTSVRFVGTATIGTDHVDTDYLRQRGIAFASAPGSNANSVAEYVAAGLCVLSSRLEVDLAGLTMGVVGVGNVGSKVVRVAEAFGMSALLNDPPLARATKDPRFLELDELMACDIVTLHVPLTRSGPDATYHFFDGRRIGQMKRGAILINTARGAVVETHALVHALRAGHIAAAVIDVWEDEPSIDTQLLEMAAIATPHIAGYSLDGKVNAARMVFESFCRYAGKELAWEHKEELPPPVHRELTVIPDRRTPCRSLCEAVLACYDIREDAARLRGRGGEGAAESIAERFRRLRATYPPRREFFATRVRLEPEDAQVRRSLLLLGFGSAR